MKFNLTDKEIDDVLDLKDDVEDYSVVIDEIVNGIIHPYCVDLDNYVAFIADCLNDGNQQPTNSELEDFCLNLSTYIYVAGGMCEYLGVRDDISKAVWKEMYHTERNKTERGTIADKDSIASLASQKELLINTCYNRAYKLMKAKVENAQELLSSCKKVLSHRMQEIELTNIGGR